MSLIVDHDLISVINLVNLFVMCLWEIITPVPDIEHREHEWEKNAGKHINFLGLKLKILHPQHQLVRLLCLISETKDFWDQTILLRRQTMCWIWIFSYFWCWHTCDEWRRQVALFVILQLSASEDPSKYYFSSLLIFQSQSLLNSFMNRMNWF